jgi:hypothetical protein
MDLRRSEQAPSACAEPKLEATRHRKAASRFIIRLLASRSFEKKILDRELMVSKRPAHIAVNAVLILNFQYLIRCNEYAISYATKLTSWGGYFTYYGAVNSH